jgi:hypothetical protein
VSFSNAREDAVRRDFTINGMFYDPETEQVIDYVDGQSDLAARHPRNRRSLTPVLLKIAYVCCAPRLATD